MSAFLTDEEKFQLTGYKRPADQVRWLQRNGVPYLLDRCKRPVVRRDMNTQRREPELGSVR